ncbi:UNVERIFIED_CONTAM: Splicing factor 3B subunit [Sesamum angustifolium]|uniref:Splicing factor 3B subunit n=1 Tax=Sesamum angustifolium TaxID=2727405 RepID=A0AAW2PW23_9LAMI
MDVDTEIQRVKEERQKMEKDLAALTSLTFDTDLYSANKFEGYEQSIPVNDEEDNLDATENEIARKMASFTAPKQFFKEPLRTGEEDEISGFKQPSKIIDREDDYRRRRLNRIISPERNDPFLDKTPGPEVRTYADVMREEALKRKEEEVKREIAKKKKEEEETKAKEKDVEKPKKRNRWDMSQDESAGGKKAKAGSDWDLPDSTPGIGEWDATPTPGRIGDATPSVSRKNRWDETPTPGRLNDSDATPAGGVTPGATPAGMAWDATPKLGGMATPTPKRQRSRWDETPATMGSATPGATPAAAYTPGVTPFGAADMATPTPNAIMRSAMTPEQYNLLRWEKDIEERNRPLTDEELDAMFPRRV